MTRTLIIVVLAIIEQSLFVTCIYSVVNSYLSNETKIKITTREMTDHIKNYIRI